MELGAARRSFQLAFQWQPGLQNAVAAHAKLQPRRSTKSQAEREPCQEQGLFLFFPRRPAMHFGMELDTVDMVVLSGVLAAAIYYGMKVLSGNSPKPAVKPRTLTTQSYSTPAAAGDAADVGDGFIEKMKEADAQVRRQARWRYSADGPAGPARATGSAARVGSLRHGPAGGCVLRLADRHGRGVRLAHGPRLPQVRPQGRRGRSAGLRHGRPSATEGDPAVPRTVRRGDVGFACPCLFAARLLPSLPRTAEGSAKRTDCRLSFGSVSSGPCSYGEGDPTDNAQEFWDMAKEKMASADADEFDLEGVNFAVFGLGNKTYEHFNSVGKFVSKFMAHFGAKELVPIGLGDDDAK